MHFMRFFILASIAFAVAHVHVCLVNGVAFAINAADRMPAAANWSIPIVATVATAIVATKTIVIKYPSGFITQATANCMAVAVGISTAAVGAYTVTLAGDSLGRIVSESASFSTTMHSPGTGGYPAFGGQVTSMAITDTDHIPVLTSSASSNVPATVSLGAFLVTFVMTRCHQRTAIKVSRAFNGCVARFHSKFAFSLLRIIVDSFRVHVAATSNAIFYFSVMSLRIVHRLWRCRFKQMRTRAQRWTSCAVFVGYMLALPIHVKGNGGVRAPKDYESMMHYNDKIWSGRAVA
jgi:hypothetical protein